MISVLSRRVVSDATMLRIVAVRWSSAPAGGLTAQPAKKQLTLNEPGYFKYSRDFSRDKRYANPAKPGDTPGRFLVRRLGHAYEIYPLIFLCGVWLCLFCYTVWWSFEKMEIWLDRSQTGKPWDWEKIRDSYWKKPTLVYDPEGVTRKRIPIMEQIQDEMVAAAKKRGTHGQSWRE